MECPNCGSGEMHPNNQWLLIKAHKVHHSGSWWSWCLVCAGFYNENLQYDNDAGNDEKGWFRS